MTQAPRWWRRWLGGGSGPAVAALFQRLLGLVQLIAFASLLVQIKVLIGQRGLLPLAPLIERLPSQHVGLSQFPTVHWWGASDGALVGWLLVGMASALLVTLRLWPRPAMAAALVLSISYTTSCRLFTGFQWDLMLIEATALGLLLPAGRPAPLAHFLFRLLLFKLYFESGVAKWQSYLHDWHDGSAMTYYYETAPIPGLLSWWFHHLPAWFHKVESWAVLVLELGLPFAIFGPRPARLAALAGFTAFQVVNILTANYGFFCYLSLALHVFLLDDADIERARARLARWSPLDRALCRLEALAAWAARVPSREQAAAARVGPAGDALRGLFTAAYLALSLADASEHFGSKDEPGPLADARKALRPFHLINTYHLFGHITRERVEAQFEVLEGDRWEPRHLRYKPGDEHDRPRLVAPHQPRVDFQLWFHGFSARRGLPPYVASLLDRMCLDPAAVQPLFRAPLPAHPQAVRVVYHRYRFTSPDERSRTGAIWQRTPLFASPPVDCSRSP